jgi:hypothetical protein
MWRNSLTHLKWQYKADASELMRKERQARKLPVGFRGPATAGEEAVSLPAPQATRTYPYLLPS